MQLVEEGGKSRAGDPEHGVLANGGVPTAVDRLVEPFECAIAMAEAGFDFGKYHYGNLALLFDGGALDPMQPEAMLYEPQKDGTLRFVAVEYIVLGSDLPPDADDADIPVMFGQKLQWDGDDGVWELHVWLWRENPSGLFYEWNPKVSCQYAPA